MGDINQMPTNTSSYTICSAPDVYIFVYMLIETRIAPLSNTCTSPQTAGEDQKWPLAITRLMALSTLHRL